MRTSSKGRWALLAVGVAACLGLLWGLGTRGAQAQPSFPQVTLTALPNQAGLVDPVDVQAPRDGSNRLFIVEQPGRIRIYDFATQALLPTPFLNISTQVSTGSEQGLLGLAFSPNYASDRTFYINYTDTAGDSRVVRYRTQAGNPNQADTSTAQLVLFFDDFASNHNGGQLQFGPDGKLYIGMGDGGGGGDPREYAQNPAILFGKMLRIDVTTGNPTTYTIPADNPFIGTQGYRPEIWSLGLRNPWRYSFDRTTGELYIGDVGQGSWEEISVQPAATGGQNWGWDCYEGAHSFEPAGCGPASLYTMPAWEYVNGGDNCSITGGYVYRGTSSTALQGIYLYGDYCSGIIWGLRRNGATWESAPVGSTGFGLTSFGEDAAGELYLANAGTDLVYRVQGPANPTSAVQLGDLSGSAPTTPWTLWAGVGLLAAGALGLAARRR